GHRLKLQMLTPTTSHSVGYSSATRSCITYALLTLYTTRLSKPSTLSTCISTTNRRPVASVHFTSTIESFSPSTSTRCSLERCWMCWMERSPWSSRRWLSRAMSRGLRASEPKIRLKTKSVLGSANVACTGGFYTRPTEEATVTLAAGKYVEAHH